MLGRTLLLTAVPLLAGACWYFFTPDADPGLVVEEPNQVLHGVPAGKERTHRVEIRVRNRTGRTLRVVGADYG